MFSMNDGKLLSMLLVAICLTAASCDTSTDDTSPEDVSESPVVEQPEQETESSYIDPAEAEQIACLGWRVFVQYFTYRI